ncbi:hypothetical protein PAXRUDRAFT_625215 [Paxillus rubicundulus Ve08.2h10]|uniref:Unplaced genomic scaffold scaffold_552, whole genome shotgun sequence n=1 Tax=Paxillus rubicundulus Ve08.2h10 TaxID=930991 RepID=A0A0D0DK73_9AGAM|nr:hypothetical protein PAXRUDRAFT_625215 [Paxillus rubicundulus Ve08.2h10]
MHCKYADTKGIFGLMKSPQTVKLVHLTPYSDQCPRLSLLTTPLCHPEGLSLTTNSCNSKYHYTRVFL